MDILERVALAIDKEVYGDWGAVVHAAQAAIAAMREPTPEMLKAGGTWIGSYNAAAGVYRAMIDEAIKQSA